MMLKSSDSKKKEQDESDQLVAKFLSKGGEVQMIPAGQRSEPADVKRFWRGRPKKKKSEEKSAD